LHLFLLDMIIVFILLFLIPIILIVEIGTRGVVTEALISACTLAIVVVEREEKNC